MLKVLKVLKVLSEGAFSIIKLSSPDASVAMVTSFRAGVADGIEEEWEACLFLFC